MADALLDAVDRIRPVLEACAPEAERERALPQRAYDAMFEAGLFGMLLPRAYGGGEVHPVEALRVIEAVSRIDSAAGWCLNQSPGAGSFTAWLPEAGAREIFANGVPVFAGGFYPAAPSVPVEGGWRVTARTAFNSGCHRAEWFAVPIVEVEEDASSFDPHTENPDDLVAFIPRDEVDLIDTWHTAAMRGTFSADVLVDDVFVPSTRIADPERGVARQPAFAGPLFGTPPWIGIIGETVVSVGIAAAAIDALLELALRKTPRIGHAPLHARARVQHHAARATALVDASRTYLHAAITDAYRDADAAGASGWFSDASGQRCQLASCFAAETCAEAVELVCEVAGTSASRLDYRFERHRRDVQMLKSHGAKSWARYEDVGRMLFGMPPEFFALEI